MAGVHFPSDISAGRTLARALTVDSVLPQKYLIDYVRVYQEDAAQQ